MYVCILLYYIRYERYTYINISTFSKFSITRKILKYHIVKHEDRK